MLERFEWTAERTAKLEELAAKGLSARQIAQEMSKLYKFTLTRNAVMGKMHRKRIVVIKTAKTMKSSPQQPVLRARMPETSKSMPHLPQRAPSAIPQYRASSGAGISEEQHDWSYCQCILDDGLRCDGPRMPGSSWCEYHKERFSRKYEDQHRETAKRRGAWR